jgi:PAS domain S-box-containing protein
MLPPFAPGDLGDARSLARALLDSMAEGVSLSSEDGVLLYTNPVEDRLFGYAPGELLGRHVSVQNAYPPGENAQLVAAVTAELHRSGAWAGDWLNRRKDGTVFASRARISAVEVDGRRCWLCLRSDTTEERAALQGLRDDRARLQLATEAAEIGVWDWDIATGAMTYSDRAKAISGLPLDQPVTLADARRVVHPDDLPHTSAQARRALDPAIRDRSAYEYRIQRPDGSVAWVLARGEAVFDEVAGETRAVRYLGTIQDVTARRALEDASRDAAQRLGLAIQAGRMAVWDVDLGSDAVAGSPELNRLLGFPEDQPLDRAAVRSRYYPGEGERVRAAFQAAMADGRTSFEADFRYVRPNDEPRWFLLRCDVQRGPDGAPRRAIGVLADITDRKQAEEDLRASELRLQLASAVAGVGVWDWNLVTGVTVWSPEEYALFGIDPAMPPAELHAAWRRLIHPEDREAVEAWMERARREPGTHPLDYRVLRGGEVRWIRSRAAVVTGEGGRAERMVGIEWDATDEHEEAAALRSRAEALEGQVEERQHQLDRFYALSNDLLAVASFDGFLKTVNPAWSRLLGISEEDLLGRPFMDLIHPDDHAAAAEVVGRLRAGSAIQEFQDRLVAKDGRHLWIAWAAAAEGDRFYAVGRDVTREREREEVLRQTQKMEALGQLTGGIAHDFNNLLQAVQGSFTLIAKRPGDAERVRLLAEHGLQAARRGGGLTGQLLAFARSRQADVRPIPLDRALADVGHLLRPSLGPMIEVAVEPPEDGLAVVADATQLEMALLNLGINARDAMPEGGTVSIRARAPPDRGGPEPRPRPLRRGGGARYRRRHGPRGG